MTVALKLLVCIPLFVLLSLIEADPCKNYKQINKPFRSAKYRLVRGDVAICDSNIPMAWYRFTSIVGGMMPETKTPPYHCGTVAPIWLRGSHPTRIGQQKPVTACTNIFGRNGGCAYPRPLYVKKCKIKDQIFYVYYLTPTSGCSMGYCAGDKKPCPKGQTGIVPNCKVLSVTPFPHYLIPSPSLTFVTFGKSPTYFSMVCNFTQFSALWTNVSFHVEWFADGKLVKKSTEICNDPEKDKNCSKRYILLHQSRIQPGERLRCRIRMRYNENELNNWTKSWKDSEEYFVGIKVEPSLGTFTVKECDQNSSKTFRLSPTVPILPIDVSSALPQWKVHVPTFYKDRGFSSVIDTPCLLDLNNSHINAGKVIKILAVCDNRNGEQAAVLNYMFEQINAHPFWKRDTSNYMVPLQIKVENTNIKWCRAYTDPHYETFDGARYNFYEHGDYILYGNPKRNFEVHTRLTPCDINTVPTGSCMCGVMVREGNDIIAVEACKKDNIFDRLNEFKFLETWVKSTGPLAPGTHVFKKVDSSSVTQEIYFPSGTRIKIVRNRGRFNVYLYAPNIDKGNTLGLCGNNNNNRSDDLYSGKIGHCTNDNATFGRSWRLQKHESLFESYSPNKINVSAVEKFYCYCAKIEHDDGSVKINESCMDNPNRNTGYVDKKLKEITLPNKPPRTRRSIHQFKYDDDTTLDLEQNSFFVHDRDADYATKRIRARRDSSTTKLRENATRYCQSVIGESTAGKRCSNLGGFNITNALLSCVSDLELTGDKTFATAVFNVNMKEGCETVALSNISLYEKDANGGLQPPSDIGNDLCPGDCNSHGNCTNRTCICDEGFISEDCSMSVDTKPELLGIYDGGLCDIRQRPCKKTDIFGDNFISSKNLTCHAKEFKVVSSRWIPRTFDIKKPGEMIDIFGVRCELPDPPTKPDDYDFEGTPAGGLWIRISNDGERKSQRQMRFVSYDSVCMSCNKTGNCSLKNNSCLIRGHCFSAHQSNPGNWCQQCMPKKSQYSWTRRMVNHPPSFAKGQSPRYAIVGESLPLQIKATDPDNRPVTYSLLSTTATSGYTLSSTGLLQLNVTSKEDFTVQVTDECNATDTITITVRIVVCPCKNGGQCSPHPYQPRGSDMYLCQCPIGFTGDKCQTNIDDCVSANCGNGSCIDRINNYTCQCNVGFTGSLCDQNVHKCTNESCFAGVQCTEIASGISCGPCPVGMSGDGKNCTETTTLYVSSKPILVTATMLLASSIVGKSNHSRTSPTQVGFPKPTASSSFASSGLSKTSTVAFAEHTTNSTSPSSGPTPISPLHRATSSVAMKYLTATQSPLTEQAITTAIIPRSVVATKSFTTSTAATAGIITPTTSSSEPKKSEVRAEIKINMKWDDVYFNKKSQEFQFLARSVIEAIFKSYSSSGNDDLEKVVVTSMRPGSINVEFLLVFKKQQSDPLLPLKESVRDGKMGALSVIPESLKIKNKETKPKFSQTKNVTLPFILVIIGVPVIIFVAAVLIAYRKTSKCRFYRMSKHSNKHEVKAGDDGTAENMEMREPDRGVLSEKELEDNMESGKANIGFDL